MFHGCCRRATAGNRTATCDANAMPSLTRPFFARSVHEVAPDLIGATLLIDGVGGRIVEVEAYHHTDPAAHSFRGTTERNAVMFGPPGYAYVYRSYGIHWCLNFVCEPEGSASAVLIRAIEPLEGLAKMRRRRGLGDERLLCSGPGRLAQALAVTRAHNGLALDRLPFELYARDGDAGDRHRRAHRHHQGGGAAVAIWPQGLEVFEQAVQGGLTRPSDAIRNREPVRCWGGAENICSQWRFRLLPNADIRRPFQRPRLNRYDILSCAQGANMRRRKFLCVLGGVAAWPLAARATAGRQGLARRHARHDLNHAQRCERWRVSGRACGNSAMSKDRTLSSITARPTASLERLPELVAELIQLRCDVLVTRGTPPALAAKRAAGAIPIVMASIGEPVEAGLVESLPRPGGNITGLSAFTTELTQKRLELLKELVPGIARVALLDNMSNGSVPAQWDETKLAAQKFGIEALLFDVRKPEDIPPAFAAAVDKRVDALSVGNTRW